MSNEIFKITIKHKIYEWCIDVVFKHIIRNFPSQNTRVPKIGEKYVYIRHNDIEETYYNCRIVDPKSLEDYDLLDKDEKTGLVFATSYKKLLYRTDEGEDIEVYGEEEGDESEGYQYFIVDDMPYLEFKQ